MSEARVATAPADRRSRSAGLAVSALGLLLVLFVLSTFVGVADLRPTDLLHEATRGEALELIATSRIPRSLALVLAGSSLAVSGLIMQLLTRNPFVEPSTVGTMEFAGLGLLLSALLVPGAPVIVRMGFGAVCALIGTALFLAVISRIEVSDILVVPLVGIMLAGIVAAVSTFIAYRAELIQSMTAWTTGDFSVVIEGRYEILWVTAVLTGIALLVADRLTVAGMGEEIATNLGLDHRRALALGMTIVSIVAAAVVVTAGMLPFVGLVVPNLIALLIGSNARRAIPWVALTGAALVLLCDILARTVRYPYELPIGTILGVVGGIAFVTMLLAGTRRVG